MMGTPESFWSRLDRLRGVSGAAASFWPHYLEVLVQASDAAQAVIYQSGVQAGAWNEVTRIEPFAGAALQFPPDLIAKLTEAAREKGIVEGVVGPVDARQALIALLIPVAQEPEFIAVLAVDSMSASENLVRQERVRLLSGLPEAHLAIGHAAEAKRDLARVVGALDLLNQLNAHKKFLPAAMAFCNELAARMHAASVAIGWQEGRYLRLKALSNIERFSQDVEIVRDLEAAMEEVLDQDDEIVWPPAPDSLVISRQHGQLAKRQSVAYMASIPLRSAGEPVGVIHLQRSDEAFTTEETALLRALADQAAPWLVLLHEHGVWWGARLRAQGRTALGKLWGVDHAWTKLGAVSIAILLVGSWFLGMTFRVDAPFILRSANQAILPAPFDGFIQTVPHEIGDHVVANEVLLTVDESSLRNREASLEADRERYEGEAKNAEGSGKLAEFRIAKAQERQAAAELAIVRHQIEQAGVRAPFGGIVAEGRFKERIGAPVRQGDLLFRVARMDQVYAEIDVDERDIHEVNERARGELAFTSRPADNFPLRVTRIEPAATPKKGVNIFIVRAELPGGPGDWWRPGMTGVAKIEGGWRSFWWMATHRLFDFLRLKLWWW
jgi:hypothetical protein